MTDQLTAYGLPAAQGLYDPANEHDACGVGFIANITCFFFEFIDGFFGGA